MVTEHEPGGQRSLMVMPEVLATRRRWMLVMFSTALLLGLASLAALHLEAAPDWVMALALAGGMAAVATWVLMTLVAQALYGWGMALLLAAVGFFVPLVIVLGVIVLNYQAGMGLRG